MAKAPVLPLPVSAAASTSPPVRMSGTLSACTGVGSSHPSSSTAWGGTRVGARTDTTAPIAPVRRQNDGHTARQRGGEREGAAQAGCQGDTPHQSGTRGWPGGGHARGALSIRVRLSWEYHPPDPHGVHSATAGGAGGAAATLSLGFRARPLGCGALRRAAAPGPLCAGARRTSMISGHTPSSSKADMAARLAQPARSSATAGSKAREGSKAATQGSPKRSEAAAGPARMATPWEANMFKGLGRGHASRTMGQNAGKRSQ